MASLTPNLLYIGNGTASNVYTVSSNSGSYTIIKNFNMCNTDTSNSAVCRVHILAPAASANANNAVFFDLTVNSKETIAYDSAIVLPAGYSIYVVNTSTDITFAISGAEYET